MRSTVATWLHGAAAAADRKESQYVTIPLLRVTSHPHRGDGAHAGGGLGLAAQNWPASPASRPSGTGGPPPTASRAAMLFTGLEPPAGAGIIPGQPNGTRLAINVRGIDVPLLAGYSLPRAEPGARGGRMEGIVEY